MGKRDREKRTGAIVSKVDEVCPRCGSSYEADELSCRMCGIKRMNAEADFQRESVKAAIEQEKDVSMQVLRDGEGYMERYLDAAKGANHALDVWMPAASKKEELCSQCQNSCEADELFCATCGAERVGAEAGFDNEALEKDAGEASLRYGKGKARSEISKPRSSSKAKEDLVGRERSPRELVGNDAKNLALEKKQAMKSMPAQRERPVGPSDTGNEDGIAKVVNISVAAHDGAKPAAKDRGRSKAEPKARFGARRAEMKMTEEVRSKARRSILAVAGELQKEVATDAAVRFNLTTEAEDPSDMSKSLPVGSLRMGKDRKKKATKSVPVGSMRGSPDKKVGRSFQSKKAATVVDSPIAEANDGFTPHRARTKEDNTTEVVPPQGEAKARFTPHRARTAEENTAQAAPPQ